MSLAIPAPSRERLAYCSTRPGEQAAVQRHDRAFDRTLKRDYVRVNSTPDAQTLIEQLPGWLADYNEVHPRRALGYRSPCEYIAHTREAAPGL